MFEYSITDLKCFQRPYLLSVSIKLQHFRGVLVKEMIGFYNSLIENSVPAYIECESFKSNYFSFYLEFAFNNEMNLIMKAFNKEMQFFTYT